jgi:hypothetical protein
MLVCDKPTNKQNHINALIMLADLRGCETWPLILREERRLKAFEERVVRK